MNYTRSSIVLLGMALLFSACTETAQPQPKAVKVVKKPKPAYSNAPKAPKKNIELKEVEDENFSSEYMYPETAKKSAAKKEVIVAETAPESAMTTEACISMIGQEKFDKYSQMYGGSAAALKKCKMLKAL